MRRTIEFIYIDAGGGHRAAATALAEVMPAAAPPGTSARVHPGSVRFHRRHPQVHGHPVSGCLQHHAAARMDAGHGATGSADARRHPPASTAPQVRVLERHWADSRPDMVVSLIPHYNRAYQAGAGPGVARNAAGDHPDRYRRLPAAFLDRAAGTVRDLRLRARGGAGARAGPGAAAHLPGLGHDPESALSSAAGRWIARASATRLGLDPDRPTGMVSVRRRRIDGDGEDGARR